MELVWAVCRKGQKPAWWGDHQEGIQGCGALLLPLKVTSAYTGGRGHNSWASGIGVLLSASSSISKYTSGLHQANICIVARQRAPSLTLSTKWEQGNNCLRLVLEQIPSGGGRDGSTLLERLKQTSALLWSHPKMMPGFSRGVLAGTSQAAWTTSSAGWSLGKVGAVCVQLFSSCPCGFTWLEMGPCD